MRALKFPFVVFEQQIVRVGTLLVRELQFWVYGEVMKSMEAN